MGTISVSGTYKKQEPSYWLKSTGRVVEIKCANVWIVCMLFVRHPKINRRLISEPIEYSHDSRNIVIVTLWRPVLVQCLNLYSCIRL
jgi:hypothetical protein